MRRRKCDEINEIFIRDAIIKVLLQNKKMSYQRLLNTLTDKLYGTYNKQKKTKKQLSRRTLSKYLGILHQEKIISYSSSSKDKRETLYWINPVYFDRSSLYPSIFGALLYKYVKDVWSERVLRKQIDGCSINVLEGLDRDIGRIVLLMLVMDMEKKSVYKEAAKTFIDFFQMFIKNAPDVVSAIKTNYREDLSKFEMESTLPYEQVERKLLNMMKDDIEFYKALELDKNIKMGNVDDIYKALPYPFSEFWKRKEIKEMRKFSYPE